MSAGRARALRLAAASLVLVVALAGCSSDDSDGADASTSVAPDATTATTLDPTATTVEAPFDPATATAEAYADALDDGLSEGSLDEGQLRVTGEQAVCMAPRWIEAIGVDALVAQEVPPGLLADPAYRFGDLGLDEAQAAEMLAAYDDCGADLYGLFALALTPDQEAAIQTCAVAEIDHDLARTALTAALTGSPSLETDLNALVTQVVDACQPGG